MIPRAGISGRALQGALALFGVLALPGSSRAQLSVDELEVFLRPDVAAQRTGVIRITNPTSKSVQALLEVQDWNRDATGSNQFATLGSLSGSCGDRLKVFPASVRIGADRTEAVRVSFDGDPTTSCWAVVFIQANEPPRPSGERSQITYVVRTGVKVYVEPGNALRAGDVDAVTLATAAASPTDSTTVRALEVRFRNTGAAHLKPTGAVEVRSTDNQVVATVHIEQFPIAPGDVRRMVLPLPTLGPGRYVALALIDYAGPDIAAGQLEFEID